MDFQKIKFEFEKRFGKQALIFRSPARINIIGEHTDYNDGFVMPAAIDKEIIFAISENELGKARIYSADLNEYDEFELDKSIPDPKLSWSNYLRGVVSGIQLQGIQIKGFDLVFGGNIPLGAGLSSSAAIEGGLAIALQKLFLFELNKMELAKIGQKAEHEFVGVKCGLMDQFANLHGKTGNVMKFDCRSLEFEYIPFSFEGYSILLCDSKVKHALASSEYNTRREECEVGVSIIQKENPRVKKLRDVSVEILNQFKNKIPPVVYKRCKFVIEENQRVNLAVGAIKNGNIGQLGALLNQSHEGLSYEYEVSCRELDFLVQFALESSAVAGARMMGGGFGGCTINLVQTSHLEEFIDLISKSYNYHFNTQLECHIVQITDGAGMVSF